MDESQSLIYLKADAERASEDASALGWIFEPWPLSSTTFIVKMSALDKQVYWFRLVWPGYPDCAPSIVCVDPSTGQATVRTAWPNSDGSRPGEGFCVNITQEGGRLHPDWTSNPRLKWQAQGNSLQLVLYFLHFALLHDPKRYHGRHS